MSLIRMNALAGEGYQGRNDEKADKLVVHVIQFFDELFKQSDARVDHNDVNLNRVKH